MGGIVFIRDNQELDIAQLPVPKDLWAAVVHPDIEILTKVARGILPAEVPLANVTQQIGNLGGLICGLIQEDYPNLHFLTIDRQTRNPQDNRR